MRLIGTLKEAKWARRFSEFLESNEIPNDTDEQNGVYNVWVADEDLVEPATEWLRKFEEDPKNPVFDSDAKVRVNILIPPKEQPILFPKAEPQPYITVYFLLTCIILYAAGLLTAPQRDAVATQFPGTALYTAEVTQTLLYDFPLAYEIIEEAANKYGVAALQKPASLPPEGQALLQKYEKNPWWHGYYADLVRALRGERAPPEAPRFEKIRQGEVWRLFTPALLHLDLFHLLFNMIWLLVLGKQIELRMGRLRYVIFCVVAAVISNTAQYLVSGPNFLGFSGILCAFFTYIWVRQKMAPWEGYRLPPSTILMIALFIGAMLLFQVASFGAEVYYGTSLAPMIANTAHITGGLTGLVLGRFNFFAWKRN